MVYAVNANQTARAALSEEMKPVFGQIAEVASEGLFATQIRVEPKNFLRFKRELERRRFEVEGHMNVLYIEWHTV